MTIYRRDREGEVSNVHGLTGAQRNLVQAVLRVPPEGDFDVAALTRAVTRYEDGEYNFEQFIQDESAQSLAFNVMPGKSVEEELRSRCYFVGPDIARAVFDRTYTTDMERSPSHVIFLSALVQWQKLIYLIMCRRCGVAYDAKAPEAFKIWPVEVQCRMPTMVREESNLTQDAFVSKIECTGAACWTVEGFAVINKRIGLIGKAAVFRVD